MALTEIELKALIDALIVQTEDLVLAIVTDMFGINKIEDQSLAAGTFTIVFATPYEVGESWNFIKKATAISDVGDYDIGCIVSNPTIYGFDVTVTEACKFSYRTEYLRDWTTD